MSGACPPDSETSGTCAGDRESPVLVGSYRMDVVAMGRPCRPPRREPLGESDLSLQRRMVAPDGQAYILPERDTAAWGNEDGTT